MDLVKKCDRLGAIPTFYYQGNSMFRTIQGGLTTILLFMCTCLALVFFGYKLIFSQLNSSTFTKLHFESPPAFSNNSTEFVFFFGIQNSNYQHIYRPDIVDVTFDLITLNKDFSQEIVKMPIHPCESADFYQHSAIFDQSAVFENAYCIEKSATSQLKLNSTFGFDSYSYLKISAQACKNTTEIAICASQEEIDAQLNGFFFDFGYIKDLIDVSDYSNPESKTFEDFYAVASQNYYKEMTLYLEHIYIESDVGWIIEDTKEDQFVSVSRIIDNLDLREKEVFLDFIIRLDKEHALFRRNYYKLQDFLAQAGGVVKGLTLIGKLLVLPFSTRKMTVSCASKEIKVNTLVTDDRSAVQMKSSGNIKTISKTEKSLRTKQNISNLKLFLISFQLCGSRSKTKYKDIEATFRAALDVKAYVRNFYRINELCKDT